MNSKPKEQLWMDVIALALVLTTVACSDKDSGPGSENDTGGGGTGGSASGGTGGMSMGGSATGTGLPSGTACVSVGSGAETCLTSGVRTSRSVNSSEISMSVYHFASGTDYCYDDLATDFEVSLRIPDGLPFPYQATERQGRAFFRSNTSCYYQGNEGPYVTGIIYQAATNGATNLEGNVVVQYDGGFSAICGMECPTAVAARFRFNVPL